jgi:(p)ppGpp synthase/HD superfamily hydrolase
MKKFKELLAENEFISHALSYATKAHDGQFRADKTTPYVKHTERVAAIVNKYLKGHAPKELIATAFLHDTIEDTNTTKEDLEKLFGGLVASLVQELTSDSDKIKEIGKTAYLSSKMELMTDMALIVKLADRLDNVSDIKTAKSESWRKKYKTQTEEILLHLEKNRNLGYVHKKLIKAIRLKLSEIE